ISVKGRHDPCIVQRILVVAECMTAMVILDSWMESSAQSF
ncbi:MAG: chorismate synthase, partial [Methanomicrobium sp.]|nr:chorismate synthase [Methanomicrobium sp.]